MDCYYCEDPVKKEIDFLHETILRQKTLLNGILYGSIIASILFGINYLRKRYMVIKINKLENI